MQHNCKEANMGATKYDEEFKANLLNKFIHYIDDNEYPILHRFAVDNNVYHELLHDFARQDERNKEELIRPLWSYAIKKAFDKRRSYLEEKTIAGKINPGAGIFALKNHGMTDQQHIQTDNKHKVTVDFDPDSAGKLAAAMASKLRERKSKKTNKK